MSPEPDAARVVERIRRLYHEATPRTIERDLARAVTLLKSLDQEDDRERASVYMDGLSQMRSEWARSKSRGAGGKEHRRRR